MAKGSTTLVQTLPGGTRASGYSEAVAAGPLIAVAGQLPSGEALGGGDFAEQFLSALDRTLVALRAAGGHPGDVIHLRIFVTALAQYEAARPALAAGYRARMQGHYPAASLVQVGALLEGAAVEIDALAVRSEPDESLPLPDGIAAGDAATVARLRVRLAPADARYAGGLVPGSKAMELFADLETELSLLEGGDEGLCVAYDMVEFLSPLHVGDFVEATATVVGTGRSSRKVHAELHKVLGVDEHGLAQRVDPPLLAVRASATIVVGRTTARLTGG